MRELEHINERIDRLAKCVLVLVIALVLVVVGLFMMGPEFHLCMRSLNK